MHSILPSLNPYLTDAGAYEQTTYGLFLVIVQALLLGAVIGFLERFKPVVWLPWAFGIGFQLLVVWSCLFTVIWRGYQ